MFGSNVQPRRIVKETRKEPWYCHKCNLENKAFYSKCPKCAEHRPH
jgi:lipopolysaccharide biosynthesis regulator YciM